MKVVSATIQELFTNSIRERTCAYIENIVRDNPMFERGFLSYPIIPTPL